MSGVVGRVIRDAVVARSVGCHEALRAFRDPDDGVGGHHYINAPSHIPREAGNCCLREHRSAADLRWREIDCARVAVTLRGFLGV